MAQHFEVAVLGREPAAILTAALLAKGGRRVLWVDHAEARYFHPKGPSHGLTSPAWLPALCDAPHIKRVHELLGLSLALRATAHAAPAFGFLSPGLRLSLSGGRDAITAELSAEFPAYEASIRALMARLAQTQELFTAALGQPPFSPAESFFSERLLRWRHRHLARYLGPFDDAAQDALFGEIPRGHPIRQMLCDSLPFVTHTFAGHSLLCALRGMSRLLSGMGSAAHHRADADVALCEAMQRAGVDMRQATALKQVHHDKRRITQLDLEGERHSIGADFVIDGLGAGIESLISHFVVPARPQPSSSGMLVFNTELNSDVVPRPLPAQSLVLGAHGSTHDEVGDVAWLLERQGGADNPRTTLSLSVPCRDLAASLEATRQIELKAMCQERLKQIVPFFDAGEPITELAPLLSHKLTPAAAYPLFQAHSAPTLGVGGRRRKTPLKNVVRVGADINPGLGLEGAYLAALGAKDLVSRMAGWRD